MLQLCNARGFAVACPFWGRGSQRNAGYSPRPDLYPPREEGRCQGGSKRLYNAYNYMCITGANAYEEKEPLRWQPETS